MIVNQLKPFLSITATKFKILTAKRRYRLLQMRTRWVGIKRGISVKNNPDLSQL